MAAERGTRTSRYPVSPTMTMILQARVLEARLEKDLKSIDLSLRRLGLLGHLQREPGVSFSALARRAGIKVQSLHPIIEGMIEDRLVTTVGGVGQGRAAVIELTERGIEALSRANAVVAEHDASHFADGEWAEVGGALTKLGEALWSKRTAGSSSAEE